MNGPRPGEEPAVDTVTEVVVTEDTVAEHAVVEHTVVEHTVAGTTGGASGWSGTDIVPAGRHRLGSVFGEGFEPSSEAESIATAVLSVPGVAGLHGGAFGEVATYLPGRQVRGVRIEPGDPQPGRPGRVEVHVVARYPTPVGAVAAEIRARLAPLAGSRPVDVYVEDYTVAGETPTSDTPARTSDI